MRHYIFLGCYMWIPISTFYLAGSPPWRMQLCSMDKLAYPSSSSSPDISLYARHSCGNESSRLGSRCFATRSYLSLSFLSLQGSLLYPTVSRLFSPETILGERFYGVQFLLSMAAIGSSLHTFVFYFWHHSSIVCSNTCLASPDVYFEVQHPCWSCNSNSSSANASAGVR